MFRFCADLEFAADSRHHGSIFKFCKLTTAYRIADSLEGLLFQANGIAVTEVLGKKICVARYNGLLYAFSYSCPHAGGLLADGCIDALGRVVCPLHGYKFDIRNGMNVTGEGYYLKRWPVIVREEGVFVEM